MEGVGFCFASDPREGGQKPSRDRLRAMGWIPAHGILIAAMRRWVLLDVRWMPAHSPAPSCWRWRSSTRPTSNEAGRD